MLLPEALTGALLVAALVAILVLAAAVVLLSVRFARLWRTEARAAEPIPREDVVELVGRQSQELEQLRTAVERLYAHAQGVDDRLGRVVSRLGVVRYDAFEDMGGALSFSAALLDEHGTGVVLSAINGRAETRCYAKQVVEGASEHNLSVEEREAIERARRSPTRDDPPPRRRRRAS